MEPEDVGWRLLAVPHRAGEIYSAAFVNVQIGPTHNVRCGNWRDDESIYNHSKSLQIDSAYPQRPNWQSSSWPAAWTLGIRRHPCPASGPTLSAASSHPSPYRASLETVGLRCMCTSPQSECGCLDAESTRPTVVCGLVAQCVQSGRWGREGKEGD